MARGKARSRYLPAGTTLSGPAGKTYRIEPAEAWKGLRLSTPAWVIGAGGFGITYRVVSQPGGEVLALKEYFPEDFADRAQDGAVTPRPDDSGTLGKLFSEGLRKFSNEAQYLQELQHPNICRVTDAFMANGTAYYVSDLVDGRATVDEAEGRIHRRVTLHDYLAELEGAPDPLTLDQVRPLIDQLLEAVEYVHTEGPAVVLRVLGFETRTLLHRDIKPSNILVRPTPEKLDAGAAEILSDPETVVQLIDFGSARGIAVDEGDGNTKSVAFITDSYAPPELKDNRISEQGPQSDIYSLAATFWRILIGKQPAMTDLIGGARAVDLGATRAPVAFLSGMDAALRMDARARPQSVADWRALLFRPEPRQTFVAKWGGRQNLFRAAGLAAVVLVGSVVIWTLTQLGGPTDQVYRQADSAYQLALTDLSAAETARNAAESFTDNANDAAEAADEAAQSARDNLAAKEEAERPRTVYNRWARITDGGAVYYGYCRLDPDGTFSFPNSNTSYHCSRYVSATTIVPGGTYKGPTSPWRIDFGAGRFEGHIIDGSPATAGVLSNGDGSISLEIETTDGATVTGLGRGMLRAGGDYRYAAGRMTVASSQSGLEASSVEGSILGWPSGETWMEGRWTPQASIGAIKRSDAVVALGRRTASGVFSGRVNLDGGRYFIGTRPVGEGLWWGALLRDDVPYYLGQVRDGAPEGCGVRIGDDGKRRGVYLESGLEDPEAFRSVCRDVTFAVETGA
jgi:serine/threonine protein kinase